MILLVVKVVLIVLIVCFECFIWFMLLGIFLSSILILFEIVIVLRFKVVKWWGLSLILIFWFSLLIWVICLIFFIVNSDLFIVLLIN